MGMTSVELLIDISPMKKSYSENVITYSYTDTLSAKYLYKSITYERYLDLHTQQHIIELLVAFISGSIGMRHA